MRHLAAAGDLTYHDVTNENNFKNSAPIILIINIIAIIMSLSMAGLSMHKHKFHGFDNPKVSYALMAPKFTNLQAENSLPQVSIIEPSNDSNFTAPANITISATASANTDISQVIFYQGGEVLGVTSFAPYTMVWSNAPQGKYVLTAEVIDRNGNTAFSQSIIIEVKSTPGTGCTCINGCDKPVVISPPFVHEGAGEFCWQTNNPGRYIDSMNLQQLNINGVNMANVWTNEYPPDRDGLYYIYYKSNSDAGHFEMK